jgi:hypothetical protein
MCTLDSEGPCVVKLYFRRSSKDPSHAETSKKLNEYSSELIDLKSTYTIDRHTNVMPYQCVVLENVILQNLS